MSSLARSISSLLPLLGQPAAAAPDDEGVLSLDLQENDYPYRIKRNARIVYVSVIGGDIIPLGFIVRSGPQGIKSTPDEFSPHGLDLGLLDVSSFVFYNLSDLRTVSQISDRISRVSCDGETRILKVAQFRYEIPYLQQEVSVYPSLTSSGFPLAPRFIGYVYEETKDRTIGFLMEEIFGNPPDIQNLGERMKTVRLLHTFGIVHGDPN